MGDIADEVLQGYKQGLPVMLYRFHCSPAVAKLCLKCDHKVLIFFTVVHTQNRGMHSHSLRRIQQLEERANAEEHNPRAQSEYLRVSLCSFCAQRKFMKTDLTGIKFDTYKK